jgi:hypothetical protein
MFATMNDEDRLKLKDMITTNGTEDYTLNIRKLKHSEPLRKEIGQLMALMASYPDTTHNNQFVQQVLIQCPILYGTYPDIYNKLAKGQIKVPIVLKLLQSLKRIEDGILSQHEASYEVGTILRQIYIDSVINKDPNEATTNVDTQGTKTPPRQMSWTEWSQQQQSAAPKKPRKKGR